MLSVMLLALALGGHAPDAAAEWRPLTADPHFEVSGRMVGGTFIYDPASKRRIAPRVPPVPTLPTLNYGVRLDAPVVGHPAAPIVMGPDGDAARLVLAHPPASHAPESGDCPDGRCPRLRPRPAPPDVVQEIENETLRGLVEACGLRTIDELASVAVSGLAVLLLALGIFLVLRGPRP